MSKENNRKNRDPEVQQMLDQHAIKQVLYNYCKGLDRFDYDMLNSSWWPEGTDNHGMFKGTGTEFCNWVFPFLEATTERTQHNVLNTYIEVKGDQAHSECNFIIWHRMLPGYKVKLGKLIESQRLKKTSYLEREKASFWETIKPSLHPRRLLLAKTIFMRNDMITAGRYIDEFECRHGIWKIKHRQVVYDWDRMDWIIDYYTGDLKRGKRGKEDYSYSLF